MNPRRLLARRQPPEHTAAPISPASPPAAEPTPAYDPVATARWIAAHAPDHQALRIRRGQLSRTWRRDAPVGGNVFLNVQYNAEPMPAMLVGGRFASNDQRLWDGFERDREILTAWANGELSAESEHVTEFADNRVVVEIPTGRVAQRTEASGQLSLN